MTRKTTIWGSAAVLALLIVFVMTSSVLSQVKQSMKATASEKAAKVEKVMTSKVSEGEYLVMAGGCNDCHSPKTFTAQGPVPDKTKLLSGFPADGKIPDAPKGIIGPDQWGALATNDFTGWSGMWGTSFTYNLTPDKNTGLGSWTQDIFLKTLRTGKHMGAGRDILPPMPWQELGKLKDEDLGSIFAYLQSLPPIVNLVHAPIPPAAQMPEHGTEGK